MEENQSNLFGISVDNNSILLLKASAQWARILAITGFILAGIMVVLGVITYMAMYSSADEFSGRTYRSSARLGGAIGLGFYVIMGIVVAVGSFFALNFANRIARALRTNEQTIFNSGLSSARNFFAFWAILQIVSLLLIILSIFSIALM